MSVMQKFNKVGKQFCTYLYVFKSVFQFSEMFLEISTKKHQNWAQQYRVLSEHYDHFGRNQNEIQQMQQHEHFRIIGRERLEDLLGGQLAVPIGIHGVEGLCRGALLVRLFRLRTPRGEGSVHPRHFCRGLPQPQPAPHRGGSRRALRATIGDGGGGSDGGVGATSP